MQKVEWQVTYIVFLNTFSTLRNNSPRWEIWTKVPLWHSKSHSEVSLDTQSFYCTFPLAVSIPHNYSTQNFTILNVKTQNFRQLFTLNDSPALSVCSNSSNYILRLLNLLTYITVCFLSLMFLIFDVLCNSVLPYCCFICIDFQATQVFRLPKFNAKTHTGFVVPF